MQKSITVLMTTKDRVKKFKKAVQSINNQVYKAEKFIYTDNNSSLLSKILKVCICIIYLDIPWEVRYSTATPGLCRDEMIRLATTDYYTFLDDDDEFHPKFLDMVNYSITDHDMYVCTYDDKYSVGSNEIRKITNIEQLPASWEKYKEHAKTKVYMDNGEKIIRRSLYLSLEPQFTYREYIYDDTVPVSVMSMRTNSVIRFADCLYKMDRGNDSLLVNAVGNSSQARTLVGRLQLLRTAVDPEDSRQVKFFNKLLKLNTEYAKHRLAAEDHQLNHYLYLKLPEITRVNQIFN